MFLKNLRSLQWRLVFIFMSVTVALMIFVGIVLNMNVQNLYFQQFKDSINDGFENWNIDTNSSYENLIDELIKNARNTFELYDGYKSFILFDIQKNVFINLDENPGINNTNEILNEIYESPNFKAVYLEKKHVGSNKKMTRMESGDYFDYARLVDLADGDYILYFRYNVDAWDEVIGQFNNIIFSSSLIAIAASLILGYFMSKTITAPIVNIANTAEKLAEGDFEQVLEVYSEDEIGNLTRTFNHMANELKQTLVEVSSEKSKVETILNYMTDGVIAFNLKGEVIHENPAVMNILEVSNFSMDFNTFSKTYDLGIMLEEVSYLHSMSTREKIIRLDNKIIRVYFALFTDEEKKAEGIIAVLQDITQQQKLEEMRREFVANVSHELRTPLTSIKSYSETLLDGALEDREMAERFLNVINSETDRMTRLVKDLLQLSRHDNEQGKFNTSTFSFAALVKSCVDKLKLEAKSKSLTLESYIIGDIPDITADCDRIEQVVLNILSNALRYTPEGGKVTAYIGKTYSEVYVKVVDTGIGIPEKDLPRIFERFYRVDKARSRELGGTGLGLSIAREIVEGHGGSITVNSQVGNGAEFIVKLPIGTCAEEFEQPAV